MSVKIIKNYVVGDTPRDGTNIEIEGNITDGQLESFRLRRYTYDNFDTISFSGKQLEILIERLKEFQGEIIINESKEDK